MKSVQQQVWFTKTGIDITIASWVLFVFNTILDRHE